MKKFLLVPVIAAVLLSGCSRDDSVVVSRNISKEADNFNVLRRIVFYNVIQDKYIFEVTGFCSITADSLDSQLEVTCNQGKGDYKKHYLGYSDNVSYTVEQLDGSKVSAYHYKIVFKPESILPFQNVGLYNSITLELASKQF